MFGFRTFEMMLCRCKGELEFHWHISTNLDNHGALDEVREKAKSQCKRIEDVKGNDTYYEIYVGGPIENTLIERG